MHTSVCSSLVHRGCVHTKNHGYEARLIVARCGFMPTRSTPHKASTHTCADGPTMHIPLADAVSLSRVSTRRKFITCEHDAQLDALIKADTSCVTIVAKAWDLHVDDILEVRIHHLAPATAEPWRQPTSSLWSVFCRQGNALAWRGINCSAV